MEHSYQIEDIIDLQFFQAAMDRFFDATRSIRIGLKDPEGRTILKAYRPGPEISPFCRLIRSVPEGIEMCARSDAGGVKRSRDSGAYCIYRCEAGLTDFAIPLYCDDEFVGSLMSGQIFLTPLTAEMEDEIIQRCAVLDVDPQALRQALHQVNVIPLEALEATLQLVAIFGQNIIDRELSLRRKTELYMERLRIAQESQRAAELEADLNLARFETLLAQVNPHFLFNALNTVARLAILESAPQTEQMAYALSRLLRYSLRKVDQLVPLEEEFQQVKTYLEIQKTRFQERLEFELYLPASLKNVLLPCMILQPLVENALVHGLEPKLTPGKIRLAARRSRGHLLIEVSDTGVGIPPEKLVLIQQQDDLRPISQRGSGLGLGIVRKRLQHYFGDQLDFDVTSQLNQGTQVRIQVPA